MSIAAIAALAENAIVYPDGRLFAVILGANPSQGARSPGLWNAAFRAHGLDAEMLPIDILPARLNGMLDLLEKEPSFIGGAIAVPHKEAVAQWLGERLTPETKAIGAVNCLYRGVDGRLMGTNTDGEGALASFKKEFGPLTGKNVLLMGSGGAGKAVSAYFAKAVKPDGRLTIVSRSPTGKVVAERMGVAWLSWDDIISALPGADVLVNCTTVGSGARANESPLSETQLSALPAHSIVFDIIYQPSPTVLLYRAKARGLPILDGVSMNLEQAVSAFDHAVPRQAGSAVTRGAMEQAKRTLV
jgi:shikimate dehydrogenase